MGLLSFIKRDNGLKRIAKRSAEAGYALALTQMAAGAKSLGSLNVSAYSMLGVAAIFAAIRIRGETLSNLPFRAMEKRGREKAESSDEFLNDLLQNSPDGQISAVEFFHTMESHSCLTGCAYAHIERNAWGDPVRVIQVPSYDVSYWIDDYARPDQHLVYNVRGKRVSSRDLLIIPFGQVYPYWQTLRPQQVLNTPIALAQALDREAYDLFKNGCSVSGVLQTDGKISESAWKRLQGYLKEFNAGGRNAGTFMTLEEGLKFVAARMSNKDAEFVNLKKQAIRDAGAIYGVPSYQLGDGERANYSSQEEQNRNFMYSTMLFRARLFENELNFKLLSHEKRRAGLRIEADFRGLMRGSMKDRAEYYAKLFNMGAITPNTIAELEDLPLGGSEGDRHYIQVNMQPLENAAALPSAPTPSADAEEDLQTGE